MQHQSQQNAHAEMLWFINQPQQLHLHPEIHEAYAKLAVLLNALPGSFSTTSAIRKLLESRDACVRACSQNLLQRPDKPVERASFQASRDRPAPIVYAAPIKKKKKAR